jgi:hypothetical protein
MHMVVSPIKAQSTKYFSKTTWTGTHHALRAMMDVAKMLTDKDNAMLAICVKLLMERRIAYSIESAMLGIIMRAHAVSINR